MNRRKGADFCWIDFLAEQLMNVGIGDKIGLAFQPLAEATRPFEKRNSIRFRNVEQDLRGMSASVLAI